MTELRAALVGFAAAVGVAPFFMAVRALTTESTVRGMLDAIVFLGAAFLVFLPVSVLAAVVIGLPAFLLGRRLGLVTWWLAAAVGGFAGTIVSVAQPANEPVAVALLQYVPLGAVAGLVFWLVRKLCLSKAPA